MLDYVDGARNEFSLDNEPPGNLLLDGFLADFFAKSFPGLDIKIGFAKEDFQTPSIYVTIPNYQSIEFLGMFLTQSFDNTTKLEFRTSYDLDGNAEKKTNDILDKKAPERFIGLMAIASARISCYADNFDLAHKLGSAAMGQLLANFNKYMVYAGQLDQKLMQNNQANPHPRGVSINGWMVDYDTKIADVKKAWVVTLNASVPYVVKLTEKYTFLTGIDVEQNAVEPTTGDIVSSLSSNI